jgi:FMN-dependent NADH-azoreductase
MTNILHIDSSPRGDRSHSRTLSHEFIESWKASHAGDTVTYRDLGHNPVPHVDENWIAAAFSPPQGHTPEVKAAIAISDSLVDEFLAADRYVFGIPMYNFNVPSTFKAYIDQVIRVGRTFAVNENGAFQGLVEGKKMLVITARGGSFSAGTPAAAYDFQEPFLRTAFGFLGITDITFINVENLASGDQVREQSLTKAKQAIAQSVANW